MVKLQKFNNGVTLIALVITIIVLLILAGVTIAMLTGDNGILTKATKAQISTELSSYKEQLELYKTAKTAENMEFEPVSLTAGKVNLSYNTKSEEETGNIKTIMPDITNEYYEIVEVIKGELILNTTDKNMIKVAQSLGIEVNPYDIEDGVLLSSENNLLLMDETGTLTLPDSVTVIGEGAFSNLEGLKKIIIPGTVKRIERNAFAYNKTLEEVIMLDGVEYIGRQAFIDCYNLKKVEMPNTINEIGSIAFSGCQSLNDIELSSKLETISNNVFANCKSLTTISLNEGIEIVSDAAFYGCENLETVKISKTVKSISTSAFAICGKLNNIELSEENTKFTLKNGMLLGNNGTQIVIVLKSAISGNKFIIPDTVTTLSNGILTSLTNITSLEIPESITNIEAHAISQYITEININSQNKSYETYENAVYTKDGKKLIRYYGTDNKAKIKDGTEIIEAFAFEGKSIDTVELPESIKSIKNQVFSGCTNLKSLTLGKNVEELNGLFIYYSAIENITIDSENSNYSIRNGALYNKEGTTFILPVKPLGSIETYEIPEGVQKIAGYTFHNQYNLKEIKLPSTLKTIGNSFMYCSNLSKIEIPSNVTSIGNNCFEYCSNLKEVMINNKKGLIGGSPWCNPYGDKAIFWNE